MSHLVTAAQVRKFLESIDGFPAWRFQQIGFPLLHLMVECIRDPEYRLPNLKVLRQALRLPCKIEETWATIDWSERQRAVHDGSACIGRPANKYRTVLARLWPVDLGFETLPTFEEAHERAISYGYQLIPQGAFDQLMQALSRFNPPGLVGVFPKKSVYAPELQKVLVDRDGQLRWTGPTSGIMTVDSSIVVAVSTMPLAATR